MNDVSEIDTEDNLKRIFRLILGENNVTLKNFILDIVTECSENTQKDVQDLKTEIEQLKNEIKDLKQKECNCRKVKDSGMLKFSEAVEKNKTVILKPKNADKQIDIDNEIKKK